MSNLAITREMNGSVDQICEKVTEAIKAAGFGVLTRIDFDQKMKEKLNENIDKCVILGACNPRLAFDAYKQSTDVALLVPCNIVVRQTAPGKVSIEALRPTQMLNFIKNLPLNDSILSAEQQLKRAIDGI